MSVKSYGAFALKKGKVPYINHLITREILDDAIEGERNIRIEADRTMLQMCSEFWVFGRIVTKDMKIELQEAIQSELKIRWFTTKCVEYSEEIRNQLLEMYKL